MKKWFVSAKKYNEKVCELDLAYKDMRRMAIELKQARSLSAVLEKLADRKQDSVVAGYGCTISDNTISLNDNVAIVVDDHFGGKVVRQQATPVVVLTGEGTLEKSWTARTPDKGRKFVLVDKSLVMPQ